MNNFCTERNAEIIFKLFAVIAARFIMKKLITFWAHIQKTGALLHTNSTHLILIGLLLAFHFCITKLES